MRWLNLGLADSNKLYGEDNVNAGRAQAELLPGAVAGFLSKHGFALADLEKIAVTTGPGYYTGVRVGLAYATSLAEGLGIGVAPVSSLYALAYPLMCGGFFTAPVLKAKKDGVYAAIYSLPQNERCLAPAFYGAFDFAEMIRAAGYARDDLVLTGSDITEFVDLQNCGYRIVLSPPSTGLALATASMDVASVSPTEVQAMYARDPG
jgi:tRNA threonylcarbamoyladenosine biosynthesis protein TsaB